MSAGAAPQLGFAAFGLSLHSDLPLPGAWQARPAREPRLQIRHVAPEEIEDSWSETEAVGWSGVIDGAPFVAERGVAGDYRFVHGTPPGQSGMPSAQTRALHHLSADARTLSCAPSDPADVSWWRVVLDSVLFTVALLHGYEAFHAGAVATPNGVLAITATTGGGKSTLLTELLRRELALMADDVLVMEARGAEPPLAHPAPPLMTVPSARLSALRETGLPGAICAFDDECWIPVPVHPQPLALKALVVLERRPSVSPSPPVALTRMESPLAPLLGALMSFPRAPERQRARFELASTLTSTIGLWRLTADLRTPPEVLADTLLAGAL